MVLNNDLYEITIVEDTTYRLFSTDNNPYDLVVILYTNIFNLFV